MNVPELLIVGPGEHHLVDDWILTIFDHQNCKHPHVDNEYRFTAVIAPTWKSTEYDKEIETFLCREVKTVFNLACGCQERLESRSDLKNEHMMFLQNCTLKIFANTSFFPITPKCLE